MQPGGKDFCLLLADILGRQTWDTTDVKDAPQYVLIPTVHSTHLLGGTDPLKGVLLEDPELTDLKAFRLD